MDSSQIERVLRQVHAALETGTQEATRDALLACGEVLRTTLEERGRRPTGKYDGSIQYTFDDEEYEPYGRAIEVRVYYRWSDYDPADDPHPQWGATVEDLEVLAVRYFDEAGNVVRETQHFTEVAWELLHQHYDLVTEACTEDGYRRGVGQAPVTYAAARRRVASSAASADFLARMARSRPTRTAPRQRRELG